MMHFITSLKGSLPRLMQPSLHKVSLHKISKALLALGISGISSLSMAAMYDIDPEHANVRFAIDHFGTSTNTGGFYNLTGKVMYDPKAKVGKVSVVIPMDQINTGNEVFNEHLKGEDFFNVDEYPIAMFDSTEWHFADIDPADNSKDKLVVTQVDGNLTMLGETHPVTLTATKFNCYFSPVKKRPVCGGDFTTTIDRTHWGISKYVLMGMTKDVVLNLQIEAVKDSLF